MSAAVRPAPGGSGAAGPSVSSCVMAHPARAAWVEDLCRRLGHTKYVWDEHGSEWETARRALLAYDPDATHHLVIQDDAVPCADLLAGVERAVAHVPGVVVSLYAGEVYPRSGRLARAYQQADAEGASWLVGSRLWWGVAACYPTGLINRLVDRCDGYAIREYDRRVSAFLRPAGIPVWYTRPSLVDHRPGPSLLSHDRPEVRRARQFIGQDRSALGLAWDGPAVEDPDYRAPGQYARRAARG